MMVLRFVHRICSKYLPFSFLSEAQLPPSVTADLVFCRAALFYRRQRNLGCVTLLIYEQGYGFTQTFVGCVFSSLR